ncbi:hypothetical protein KSF78_0005869 [Schistosoma japonicum]|nr:hypothetical protein KSF78_0005869 [Schistosoma japonicum]
MIFSFDTIGNKGALDDCLVVVQPKLRHEFILYKPASDHFHNKLCPLEQIYIYIYINIYIYIRSSLGFTIKCPVTFVSKYVVLTYSRYFVNQL